MRRRSSLDSTDIEHIQVDGDLEYAVVTKVRGGVITVKAQQHSVKLIH